MADSIPQTVNERLTARIDAVLAANPTDMARYGMDDRAVLEYIREQIQPDKLALRTEDNGGKSVTHLHEVAAMRLKPYERQEA